MRGGRDALSTLVIRVFSTSRIQCKVKNHLQVKKTNQMRARRVYKSQKQCIRTARNHATISQLALLLVLDAQQTQKHVYFCYRYKNTCYAGRHSRRHAASQIFVLSWRRNTPVLPATEMTLPVLLVAVSAQWSKLAWLPLLFWQSVGRVAVLAEAAR